MTPQEAEVIIATLNSMTLRELQAKWVVLFGTHCYSHSKEFLVRRITWKLRQKVAGGLSERAAARVRAIRDESLYRYQPRKYTPRIEEDAVLRRGYKGKVYEVVVAGPKTFLYKGKKYDNLTAIAWEIAGYQVSGNKFFNLPAKKRHAE